MHYRKGTETHCHNGHDRALYTFVLKSGKTGCRACKLAGYRKWAKDNPAQVIQKNLLYRQKGYGRKDALKCLYGLSLDDYASMVQRQGGVCAICGNPPRVRNLSVDHNHNTGTIRGLLCDKCNLGLGLLGDHLLQAQNYLQQEGTLWSCLIPRKPRRAEDSAR
jgi:hypothetical protein